MPSTAEYTENRRASKPKTESFKLGTNYSSEAIQTIRNLCKNEKKAKQHKSTNYVKKMEIMKYSSKTDFVQTELTEGISISQLRERKNSLEFLPFVQERDGMGKIINKELPQLNKIKVIRLEDKCYSDSQSYFNPHHKNSITSIIFQGLKKKKKTEPIEINEAYKTWDSAFNFDKEKISFRKFQLQKGFEPLQSLSNSTKSTERVSRTGNFLKREKLANPCIGLYDYDPLIFSAKISRDISFKKELSSTPEKPFRALSQINSLEAFNKLNTPQVLASDFGKQISRGQAILKWAPAIYEKDKLKIKQKEKEFRENENKDLEKEYHFNRYLHKKYLIKHYVPHVDHDLKKSAPFSREKIQEHTLKYIQKYGYKKSSQELKRIFKLSNK